MTKKDERRGKPFMLYGDGDNNNDTFSLIEKL